MTLQAIRSFSCLQHLQTPSLKAYGWGVMALVVTEIAVRWRGVLDIPRVSNSEELRAERYQELTQGMGLLGLAAIAYHWQSGVALASIAVVALGRLYGDLKIIPWLKNPAYQAQDIIEVPSQINKIDTIYYMIQGISLVHLAFQARALKMRHPNIGLIVGGVGLALPGIVRRVFRQLVKQGFLDLSSSRLTALKIERVASCILSLQWIRVALLFGIYGLELTLKNLSISNFLQGVAFGSWVGILCASQHLFFRFFTQSSCFVSLYNEIYDSQLEGIVAARHLLQEIACYKTLLIRDFFDPVNIDGKILEVFNKLSPYPSKVRTYFGSASEIFERNLLDAAIQLCPTSLTPEFLVTQPEVWKNATNEQIKTFMLTAEMKSLLNNGMDKERDTALQRLEAEIKEKENAGFTSFAHLRPLRERLDALSFSKVNHQLSCMPETSEKEIVVQLNQLKTQLKQEQMKSVALEEKLETLCGDVEYVYNGMQQLRNTDMESILKEIKVEWYGEPGRTFYNLLAQGGIKWKGDLVAQRILQSTGEAPSREELVKRFADFLNQNVLTTHQLDTTDR